MSQGRYVWIAGKKVYLNPELQKEWDKLINKERYRLHQMLKYKENIGVHSAIFDVALFPVSTHHLLARSAAFHFCSSA